MMNLLNRQPPKKAPRKAKEPRENNEKEPAVTSPPKSEVTSDKKKETVSIDEFRSLQDEVKNLRDQLATHAVITQAVAVTKIDPEAALKLVDKEEWPFIWERCVKPRPGKTGPVAPREITLFYKIIAFINHHFF